MRIGGAARYYAEIRSEHDCNDVDAFAREKKLPLWILGGGSNTIFADGEINAVVARMVADGMIVEKNRVIVEAGKNLPLLINELAARDLDLSVLTGILGTVGGAVFGNAGEGPQGTWIDHFVAKVRALCDGAWKTFDRAECEFSYRESVFKHMKTTPIIWGITLEVPSRPKDEISAEIDRRLKRRLETQPHIKTAGSCFKAVNGTPAWQLIDAAGLRGKKIGGVQIAEKHANFLLNVDRGSYRDTMDLVKEVKESIPDLDVEMRFVAEDGAVAH
jgi:UDP-N-acetylmuramate dehydrogenase